MAVAAPARPGPHGQRSPTLSDAGMILPVLFEVDSTRGDSPAPYSERPPSPPALYTRSSHVQLRSAPQERRRGSHQTKSPSLAAQSSHATLRNMGDAEMHAKNAFAHEGTFASSPTIEDALRSHPPSTWDEQYQRRLSTASSSVLSEDFENWPGFDSHQAFDDSGVDLEHKRKIPLGDTDVGDEMGNERWLNERNSGSDDDDDDPYSSAALSRRAEIILANAKKRLNVCKLTDPDALGQC